MKAQSGEIGGDVSHEFMAVAAVGEDDFVWCQQLRLRGEHRSRDQQELPGEAGARRRPGDGEAAHARAARDRLRREAP